jgi:hypothetical protein
MALKSLPEVEIFSAGKWNGDVYTVEDLDEMVRAFNDTHETCKPALKLGHDDNQKLLQQDGYPAAGWVGKVYRKGEKLCADFIDIPGKIYELLKKGAYKKVSSEIYWDADINGKPYKRMLAGVALLGADMPAVSNLKDMLALYTRHANPEKFDAASENEPNIRRYTFGKELTVDEKEKIEAELKAAQDKAAEVEAQLKAYKAEQDAKTAELEELKKYKEENEKRVADLEAKNREAELEKSVSEFASESGISPAMKPYVKAFLGEEKKTYSFKQGDKDKSLSKAELLKEILGLHAEALKLNTKERTVDGEKLMQEKDLHVQAEKYSKEHGVSYSEAAKAVSKAALNRN